MRWSFRTNGNFIDFVHTDETSLAIESTVFHLHNTSKCIDWSLPSDTTRINFTIDETKYSNILITDIDFDGTVMNSQDDFETGIEAMFPGLAGGGGGGIESVVAGDNISVDASDPANPVVSATGGAGYLSYVALLNQAGTDDPVATVLVNTLGGVPEWDREGIGEYPCYLANAFTTNKTVVLLGPVAGFAEIIFVNNGELKIVLYSDSFASSDDLLNNCAIEIRVYP